MTRRRAGWTGSVQSSCTQFNKLVFYRCSVSVFPPLNPDHEELHLPQVSEMMICPKNALLGGHMNSLENILKKELDIALLAK